MYINGFGEQDCFEQKNGDTRIKHRQGNRLRLAASSNISCRQGFIAGQRPKQICLWGQLLRGVGGVDYGRLETGRKAMVLGARYGSCAGPPRPSSPPLSRATGGPSSSRRKANGGKQWYWARATGAARDHRDRVATALSRDRWAELKPGKKRSEEPEAWEAEREDRPNGSGWKRAAVAREGERIAEDAEPAGGSDAERSGGERIAANERAAVAREGVERRSERGATLLELAVPGDAMSVVCAGQHEKGKLDAEYEPPWARGRELGVQAPWTIY
ncbi:hypothetical protein LXA43DRAFT_1069800 [Ganoderma leucocontextum]|nr:hypothetical protein LXA43DRAFT_1069800 [Ganoderma leucocontextum]